MLGLYVERSCQHSAFSTQLSAFSASRLIRSCRKMNRTVIRGTERYAELDEASWRSGSALSRAATSTDQGWLNAEC